MTLLYIIGPSSAKNTPYLLNDSPMYNWSLHSQKWYLFFIEWPFVYLYFKCMYTSSFCKRYSTEWQKLDICIIIGCVIFPLLFLLVMEMILRCTNDNKTKKTVLPIEAL